jgi:hypothetical protein
MQRVWIPSQSEQSVICYSFPPALSQTCGKHVFPLSDVSFAAEEPFWHPTFVSLEKAAELSWWQYLILLLLCHLILFPFSSFSFL